MYKIQEPGKRRLSVMNIISTLEYAPPAERWVVDHWRLLSCQEEEEEEVKKLYYIATHLKTGEKVLVHHCPYERMNFAAFEAHVRNGFSRRKTMSGKHEIYKNWNNKTILEEKENEIDN